MTDSLDSILATAKQTESRGWTDSAGMQIELGDWVVAASQDAAPCVYLVTAHTYDGYVRTVPYNEMPASYWTVIQKNNKPSIPPAHAPSKPITFHGGHFENGTFIRRTFSYRLIQIARQARVFMRNRK